MASFYNRQATHNPENGVPPYSEKELLLRVRRQRVHLEHESRMLLLALEELAEENAQLDAEEGALLHDIASDEETVIRCLIEYAVQHVIKDEARDSLGNAIQPPPGVSSSTTPRETSPLSDAALCDLLKHYTNVQDTITQDMQKELERSYYDLQRARDASFQPGGEDRPDERDAETEVQSEAVAEATACEVELLREMTAEVSHEIDAVVLEYGTTLFLRN